ncbi:thiol reductant ABC exporter subunit CydD [Alloyangia pacifica]|uniref:ATP-binding cassette, subfamily C, CydD n=1 Tax=Alloyangia pacifica TaxID=311180 RepID=A0A1I6S039_9RHOB|nr:thiol reductant ABC exporter subunit CydD [Alloyangia pacifica]SDG67940.1 ATP-binding cassette, subfamily C, CydD [Alloyangia pacifica]SFS70302.1 ATP-binding cassette, subfamily C, CydD [Alloyangia pacifica]
MSSAPVSSAAEPELQRAESLLGPDAQRRLSRAARLSAIAAALWLPQAAALAWGIAGWAEDAPLSRTLWMALVFALLGLLRAQGDALASRLAYRAADQVLHAQRQALLDREALRLGGASSGALSALLTEKLAVLGPWITRYRPAMARARLLPLLYLAVILTISWAAGLVLLVAGPLIPVFMALVGMAAKDASQKQMVEVGAMNTLLIDRISALPDLLLLNAAAASRAEFAARAEGLRERTMAVLRVAFLSSTVLELFSALGVAMVAVYVGFSLLGEITIGTWGLFGPGLTLFQGIFLLLLAPDFFQPLRDLAAAWHDRAAAEAVAEELGDLRQDRLVPVLGQGGDAPPLPGPAAISLRGVSVRRGEQVVTLPDIEISPGESLALRGASGVGKSTALDVVAGLLVSETGQTRVAGHALVDDTADAWRARIAYIPQEVHIPDMTLRTFLTGDSTSEVPPEALHRARATRIVAALPEGLETVLGESGAGVSGGEARRLLLARALIRGADVILADEPTADLDATTGAAIIEVLQGLCAEGRTVVVATHDPALAAAMGRALDLEAAQC